MIHRQDGAAFLDDSVSRCNNLEGEKALRDGDRKKITETIPAAHRYQLAERQSLLFQPSEDFTDHTFHGEVGTVDDMASSAMISGEARREGVLLVRARRWNPAGLASPALRPDFRRSVDVEFVVRLGKTARPDCPGPP